MPLVSSLVRQVAGVGFLTGTEIGRTVAQRAIVERHATALQAALSRRDCLLVVQTGLVLLEVFDALLYRTDGRSNLWRSRGVPEISSRDVLLDMNVGRSRSDDPTAENPVDRVGGSMGGADRPHGDTRPSDNVPAGKHIGRRSTPCLFVDDDLPPAIDGDCRPGQAPRVHRLSDGKENHIGLYEELGSVDRNGSPPAVLSRLAQFHPNAPHPAQRPILDRERNRLRQVLKLDPFPPHLGHLVLPCRHLLCGSAIQDLHLRTEPTRTTRRVHRRVSSTNHRDAARESRPLSLVHPTKEVCSLDHRGMLFSRDPQ